VWKIVLCAQDDVLNLHLRGAPFDSAHFVRSAQDDALKFVRSAQDDMK